MADALGMGSPKLGSSPSDMMNKVNWHKITNENGLPVTEAGTVQKYVGMIQKGGLDGEYLQQGLDQNPHSPMSRAVREGKREVSRLFFEENHLLDGDAPSSNPPNTPANGHKHQAASHHGHHRQNGHHGNNRFAAKPGAAGPKA